MEPTVQPNGHVWATWGPATGSPTAKPKLGTSRLKIGLGQGGQSSASVLWPASPPRQRSRCERRTHGITIDRAGRLNFRRLKGKSHPDLSINMEIEA